jgi:hypothetical protein
MKLFFLIASMLLPQAPAVPAAQVAGAVTGIVVVSGTTQGIPDADIQITAGNQKWDAVSDVNGRFTLNNVPAGRHTLNIQADGYYAAVTGNSPTGPLVSMPVTVGQSTPSVTVSMIRGAVISGKVLDSSGRPLIAAEVAALTVTPGKPVAMDNLDFVATRTTDDRGEYRLFWLPPGEYFVGAVPRPSVSPGARAGSVVVVNTKPTFFPSTADVTTANKVTVKAGDDIRGIDVSARPDGEAQQKISSIRVSGQVTNALYPSAAAGQLLIAPKGGGATGTPQVGNVLLNGPTVPFDIPALPPGSYDLYIRVGDPRGTPGRGGVVSAWGHAPLELTDRDVDGVQLTLHASVEVSGVLQIDGKAAPAGGAMKIALLPTGTLDRLPSYTGVTDRAPSPGPDGAFSIPAVPNGNFTVNVNGMPAGFYVSDVRQSDTSIFARGLDVGASTPRPIEVFVRSDGGTVEGVVKTAEPATVGLIPDDRQMMRLARYVSTSADGKFSIQGVRPGAYKVFAIPGGANGPQTIPSRLPKIEDKGSAITVKASATTTTNVSVIEE